MNKIKTRIWENLLTMIPTIDNKEAYYKTLNLFYKELGKEMLDRNMMLTFWENYNLDSKLHIEYENLCTDLKKIKFKKENNITNIISYKKAMKSYYKEFSENEILSKNKIQDFVNMYELELDTLLHFNYSDVSCDFDKILYIGEIRYVTDIDSYKDLLAQYSNKYDEKNACIEDLINDFMSMYEIDTKLNLKYNDVYNDWRKLKLTGKIGNVTDIDSYKSSLYLYYDKNKGNKYIFDREKIDEFINVYGLETQFHICFFDVWNDLAKIHFKDEIGVITDKHSYLKSLELYYNEFDDCVLFDEEILSKFVSTYQLDTRFHISLNDVWNDLAKIKRQSELEYEIMDEIEGVEDIESYKDALELYYNVFGEDMFAIEKVQSFIDTFKLNKLDITSNVVYRDLRAIKRAFESGNEVSYKNSKPVQANTKPNKTTNATQAVQPQSKQNQITSNISTIEDNHDNLEKKGVDKNLGKRNQKHGDFYFYVVNMSDTQLINTINGQYKAIKGAWSLAPCMGEYGSIEFAATLLLWEYALRNFKSNPTEYGSLLITLGDMIGCSFFGMPAGEWSDNVDPILNAHTDILTRDEFGSVYNYLRNNYADEIHSMEFNKGNANEEVYTQLYIQFLRVYNTRNNFSETLDFYAKVGLKIKDNFLFNVGS